MRALFHRLTYVIAPSLRNLGALSLSLSSPPPPSASTQRLISSRHALGDRKLSPVRSRENCVTRERERGKAGKSGEEILRARPQKTKDNLPAAGGACCARACTPEKWNMNYISITNLFFPARGIARFVTEFIRF